MKKIFIVNPSAGNNRAEKVINAIEQICQEDHIDYEIKRTKTANEATSLGKRYKNYSDTSIYSVGGDGTLNLVVNGMAGGKAPLTVIPAGTGNDFFRNDAVNGPIDLGLVNDKYFINVASIGMDADVANYANIYKLQKCKGNVYIKAAAKTLFTYDVPTVLINDELVNLNILAVCNGSYYGNGIKVAPSAKINDGYLDICNINGLSNKAIEAYMFMKLLKGKHIGSSCVNYYPTSEIMLKSQKKLICNVDGEIIKAKNFKFTIVKNALTLKEEDNVKIRNLIKSLT